MSKRHRNWNLRDVTRGQKGEGFLDKRGMGKGLKRAQEPRELEDSKSMKFEDVAVLYVKKAQELESKGRYKEAER